MQLLGRWLSTWGQDEATTQGDLDRRVDAIIERVNAVVARAEKLPKLPTDPREHERG